MSKHLCLPPGSKISEERVLRGFLRNIQAGVDARDPGSIKASISAKVRLAEILGEKKKLAALLRTRSLP